LSGPDLTHLIRLTFSRDELILVNNALNEVCNGIEFTDSEFQTRLCGSREETRKVLERVAEALSDNQA